MTAAMAPPAEKPANVDAVGVDPVLVDDVSGEPRDQRRLATATLLVFGLEPVPVSPRISAARLLRIGDQEPAALGKLVHPGAGGKVIGALRTPVQHHDQGPGLAGVLRGDVQLAGTLPGRVAIDGGRQRVVERPARSTVLCLSLGASAHRTFALAVQARRVRRGLRPYASGLETKLEVVRNWGRGAGNG
jgi:hypothetical protein